MMSRVNARSIQRSLIDVLYVNKQEFSASSWRSNQSKTACQRGKVLCDLFSNIEKEVIQDRKNRRAGYKNNTDEVRADAVTSVRAWSDGERPGRWRPSSLYGTLCVIRTTYSPLRVCLRDAKTSAEDNRATGFIKNLFRSLDTCYGSVQATWK